MAERGADVAVIGAGIVGLAVAFALTERGGAVRVYERGVPGGGQSGGDERLFRHAHADPRLAAFARDGRAVWDRWAERLGVELIGPGGALAVGPAVEERLRVLDAAGVDARLVDADELAERLPLLAGHPGPALFDVRGGSIRAAAAVRALTAALGPEALVSEEVIAVRPLDDGRVEVRAGGRADVYARAVVCAGPGTAPLARGAGVQIPVALSLHARATFGVRAAPSAALPGWQDGSGVFGETGVYGVPGPGDGRFSLGVGATAAPDEPAALADMVARAGRYVVRALPGLEPAPAAVRHCWVTALPWGDDGLGVWEAGGALFVAGNNLFKHAPGLALAVARAATGAPLPELLLPGARLGAPPAEKPSATTGAPPA